MLVVACLILGASYWRFAPARSGTWEAAAKQIEKQDEKDKRTGRVLLFHPAWQLDVLDRMQQLPIILVDGRQHLDLAGLGDVLFASETAPPEALVENVFHLEEWRDFVGKAVAVLRVAAHSLSVDFATTRVFVEDSPGVAECAGDTRRRSCPRQNVVVERRELMITGAKSRCLWAQAPAGVEIVMQLRLADLDALKDAELYLARGDADPPAPARAVLRVDDAEVAVAELGASDAGGRWHRASKALRIGSRRVELAVTAERGVCVDLELSK
ncbi:MAG: hypothetical protein IT381_18730 [Deltaproteobacteria bacterium]|nr:hypothetical protein [Deltaproteobacteria bacterium]